MKISEQMVGVALAGMYCVVAALAITHPAIFTEGRLDEIGKILRSACASEEEACFRAWVDATSGWVAAAFAAVTFWFLIDQLKMQRDQTDFQLGNAEPTIDALQHARRPHTVLVRVTNWNRRLMVLRGFRFLSSSFSPGSMKVVEELSSSEVYATGESTIFVPPRYVKGWIDRASKPDQLELQIRLDSVEAVDWSQIKLRFDFELLGLERKFSTETNIHITTANALAALPTDYLRDPTGRSLRRARRR